MVRRRKAPHRAADRSVKTHRIPPLNASLINQIDKSTSTGGIKKELEDILNRCWISAGEVPNYYEFKTWIAQKFDSDPIRKLVFNRVHSSLGDIKSPSFFLLQEIQAQTKIYRDKAINCKQTKPKEYLKNFNKYKLLLSVTHSTSRDRELLEISEQEYALQKNLDDNLDECSQAQLRFRLFACLQQKKWPVAYKIIGKLNSNAHDEGEIAYLEAVVHFYTNDFNSCINYCKRIKSEDADFPGASALWIESLAYIGDTEGFWEQLGKMPDSSISPMYARYLFQTLLFNTKNPKAASNGLEESLQSSNKLSLFLSNINPEADPFSRSFNLSSCSLALDYALKLEERNIAKLLWDAQQSDGQMNFTSPQEGQEHEEWTEFLNKYSIPLEFFDPEILKNVKTLPKRDLALYIERRLLEVSYKTETEDYCQALETLLKLGCVDDFIERMERLCKSLSQKGWPSGFMDVLRVACVEASVKNHPSASIFISELGRQFSSEKFSITIDEEILQKQRVDGLSSMGKLSYQWAMHALVIADGPGSEFTDAGMIALGFFRVLELELNNLLLSHDDQNSKYLVEIEDEWSKLEAKLQEPLPGNAGKRREKSLDFWRSIINKLVMALTSKKSGLELGPLELLLNKVVSTNGEDADLKFKVASLLKMQLSTAGCEALMSGDIAQLINRNARERFRNPPAHTRFLPLQIAKECKSYVDNALFLLGKWKLAHNTHENLDS
jgi:hypothetical protein